LSAAMAGNLSLTDGEYLFREGESGEYAYIVNSGKIEITKISANGEDVLVTLEPPSLFGEMALIDGSPRSASARAKGDTIITEVTSAAFDQYIKKNPEAAVRIMKGISENLRTANQVIAQGGSASISSGKSFNESPQSKNTTWSDIDDTDDIYDRSPATPLLYTIYSLLGFVILSILFGSLSQVDTTVSARGQFTTRTPNIIVEAGANSIVREILVERGEEVKEGQTIALLDNTMTTANLNQNKQIIRNLEQKLNRLTLEKSYIENDALVTQTSKLDALNFDTLKKRVAEYREKINSFNSRLEKSQTALTAENIIYQIAVKQEVLKAKIEAVQKNLYNKKIVTVLNYYTASDATLNAERGTANTQKSINSISSEITILGSENKAFVAQWASTLTSNITSTNEQLMQAQQERIKLVQLANGVIIKAPVDGIVLDLPAVSEGAIVREGDKILTLVQANEPLYLEVDIDPKDISDLKMGLQTSVKIDAMPFQKYGDVKGEVIFVSQDTFSESLAGAKGFYYRGRIKTQPLSESAMPRDFLINQGMLASADI